MSLLLLTLPDKEQPISGIEEAWCLCCCLPFQPGSSLAVVRHVVSLLLLTLPETLQYRLPPCIWRT